MSGGEKPGPLEFAKEAFDAIREAFPELSMREFVPDDRGMPQLFLEIPRQEGLAFDVTLCVDGDILYLVVGRFSGEWFPCTRPDVVDAFVAVVRGILSGQFRIVELPSRGVANPAVIQVRRSRGWKTIARSTFGPWFITRRRLKRAVRILHNTGGASS